MIPPMTRGKKRKKRGRRKSIWGIIEKLKKRAWIKMEDGQIGINGWEDDRNLKEICLKDNAKKEIYRKWKEKKRPEMRGVGIELSQ